MWAYFTPKTIFEQRNMNQLIYYAEVFPSPAGNCFKRSLLPWPLSASRWKCMLFLMCIWRSCISHQELHFSQHSYLLRSNQWIGFSKKKKRKKKEKNCLWGRSRKLCIIRELANDFPELFKGCKKQNTWPRGANTIPSVNLSEVFEFIFCTVWWERPRRQ